MLADAAGAVTDSYHLAAWGHQFSSTGSTPNPYRYGAAWGYITDPSGMLQLGARFYWPEVGRFVSQDPIGEGANWYTYVGNRPTVGMDPNGFSAKPCPPDPCKECTEAYKKAIKACADKFSQNGLISGGGSAIAGGKAAKGGGCGGLLAFLIGGIKFIFDLNAYADCLQDAIDDYKACWAKHKCKGDPPGLASKKKPGGGRGAKK